MGCRHRIYRWGCDNVSVYLRGGTHSLVCTGTDYRMIPLLLPELGTAMRHTVTHTEVTQLPGPAPGATGMNHCCLGCWFSLQPRSGSGIVEAAVAAGACVHRDISCMPTKKCCVPAPPAVHHRYFHNSMREAQTFRPVMAVHGQSPIEEVIKRGETPNG